MAARSGWKGGFFAVGGMRWQYHVALAALALLLFILPIPHTISLRYLLLLAAAGLFGYLAVTQADFGGLRRLRWPAVLFAALSVWMVLGSVFLSHDPRESLAEIQSQWLMAFLSLMTGVAAGIAAPGGRDGQQRLVLVVVAVFLVHVLCIDIQLVWHVAVSDTPVQRAQGLTDGPDKASYLTSTLFALLLSELFQRFIALRPMPGIRNFPLLAALLLAVVSLYVESVRNAVPTLIVTGAALVFIYASGNYYKHLRQWMTAAVAVGLFVTIILSLAAATTMQRGTSWDHISRTALLAWDTGNHKGWLDEAKYGLPRLPDGRQVEPSTYIRVAWIKEGLVLVSEHPLGTGFDRNAFGRELNMKYGAGAGHSHSGVLDLAIGTGIPGVLLWFAFLGSLAALAWRQLHGPQAFAALTLLLIVLDYSTRMFLDSIVKDHMLQQFMLLVGLLAALAIRAPHPDEHAR